jgi:hypothetical protein
MPFAAVTLAASRLPNVPDFPHAGHGAANPETKVNYLIPVDVALHALSLRQLRRAKVLI